MLSRTELEGQSLFYYLKEGVLGQNFTEEVQNEPLIVDTREYNGVRPSGYLIVDPEKSVYGKLASSNGRGWTSFKQGELNPTYIFNETKDEYVPTYNTPFFNYAFKIPIERESTYIKVRDQHGNLMDRSWYQLDYNSCRVRFPAPTTPTGVVLSGLRPATIDYRFHRVSTMDGWPTDEILPNLPIVSLYTETESIKGYQIGPGISPIQKYVVDIFATDNSNKKQLTDIIKQSLYNRHISVVDFNRSGYPLTPWGVINEDFIQSIPYNGDNYRTYLTLNPGNGQILYFLNIEVFYDSSPRSGMSASLRHRAKVRFTTQSFSDRDPELVGKFSGLKEPVGGFDSLIRKAYTA